MLVNELTALEAISKIECGSLTSELLAEACLRRILEREALIGAWQFIDPDQVRVAAGKASASRQLGPLNGIPIAVKDIFNTADMPTTYGSAIYRDHRPPADASAIAITRAAGGVILGKTVTTEFAYFEPGKTANPHNPSRTPGGSSSGSAAAVADFMTPLAFGSQTVGSTVRPASYCGVVGFKPSFGLIDRTGMRPLAETFDTVGLFARNVTDVAYFASVLSRRQNLRLDEYVSTPPKIALCCASDWPGLEHDARLALETAARLAIAKGGKLTEIKLPKIFADLAEAQGVIVDYEMSNTAAFELKFRRDKISNAYMFAAKKGEAYTPEQYDAALATINTSRDVFDKFMEDFDALLMPSASGEAPEGLKSTGDPAFNRLGTAMYGPCLNVPGLSGATNMPIGIQLIGKMGLDKSVLSAGHWLFEVLRQ